MSDELTTDEQLEALVDTWYTLPDIAEMWGVSIGDIRRAVEDHELLAVKRGKPKVLSVPAELVDQGQIEKLAGTITLLLDGGFSESEALLWLMTPDDTLPGTPISQLREGKRGEVRRRAMALAF